MKQKEFFIGSDISKGYADFIILDSELTPIKIKGSEKGFKLDDTPEGHRVLKRIIKNLQDKYDDSVITIGFESTGGYENNWINYLQNEKEELNLKIVRLNGYKINKHTKATMNEVITDPSSAYSIADYMIRYKDTLHYLEKEHRAEKYRELGKEFKFANRREDQAKEAIGELETMLVTTNPGMLSQWKDKASKWFYKVLKKYPTAKCLSEASIEDLSDIPYVKEEKARELIKIGKETAPNSRDSERLRMMIREISNEILTKKARKKDIVKHISHRVNQDDLRLLKSIPYFGNYTAVGLCLELVDIERFSSSKKFVSYFGLPPKIKESGDGKKKSKMSKKGSNLARKLLYLAVSRMIGNDTYINELYEEYLDKGKGEGCTHGILMHKLARMIYGILKNREEYSPHIDRKNRARKEENEEEIEEDINESKLKEIQRQRRLQPECQYAPVSNTERKKRKKRKESQEVLASNTRSPSASCD